MSEFTQYLLVREPTERTLELARTAKLTAVVVPNRAPWTLVVVPELDDDVVKAFPCCVSYDYAEDHGVGFAVYAGGRLRGRLSAASEVGHRHKFDAGAWTEQKLLSAKQAAAFTALLAGEEWSHDEVRDQMVEALKFDLEDWISWRLIAEEWPELLERFPAAVRLDKGAPFAPKKARPEGNVAALLKAEAAAAEPAPAATGKKKKPKSTPLAMSAEESRAIAETFKHSAPIAPQTQPKDLVAEVDLAMCTSSREWLDAKKRIDPKTATDRMVAELERTIRDGRFAAEGERAAVVREAAAMLLGRCVAARGLDRVRWVEARRSTAKTAEERAAWDIVENVAATQAKK